MVEIVEKSRNAQGGVIEVDYETVAEQPETDFFPMRVTQPVYLGYTTVTAEPTHEEFTKALFAVTVDDSQDEPPDFPANDGFDD